MIVERWQETKEREMRHRSPAGFQMLHFIVYFLTPKPQEHTRKSWSAVFTERNTQKGPKDGTNNESLATHKDLQTFEFGSLYVIAQPKIVFPLDSLAPHDLCPMPLQKWVCPLCSKTESKGVEVGVVDDFDTWELNPALIAGLLRDL